MSNTDQLPADFAQIYRRLPHNPGSYYVCLVYKKQIVVSSGMALLFLIKKHFMRKREV